MDVGYKNSSGNFSLRAAALVIQDNKLLVAHRRFGRDKSGTDFFENSATRYSERDNESGKL